MNIKSKIIYKNNKNISNNKYNKYGIIRTLFEIIMGFFIIFILFILYRKYRNTRKLHANELEDNNYVYITKENKDNSLYKENELK